MFVAPRRDDMRKKLLLEMNRKESVPIRVDPRRKEFSVAKNYAAGCCCVMQ